MEHIQAKNKQHTLELTYMAACIALMAVCSWISIPTTVPFTLQTFAVFLTVGLLGGRRGTLTVLAYLLLGALGIPIFSHFTGGLGSLLGATGGYLAGFLLSALVMWGMEKLLGSASWVLALSMVLGLVVCYTFGTLWFIQVYSRTNGPIGLFAALAGCVFPFVLPDLAKILLALTLCRRLKGCLRL